MTKIRRLKLVNFSGIYVCMGKYEIEINRSDNPLCVLIGANGSGKTTILSAYTPATIENLQGRTESQILENKVGIKELDIELHNKYLYKIVITYDKKTSCYIHKYNMITHEDLGELNASGNVNSYYTILENELGYTKNFINVGFLNSRITDIVSMSAANRSSYIQVWLPQIAEYIDAYSIAQKKYNIIKKQIDLLNNDIGKLSDTDYDLIINNYNSSLQELQQKLGSIQELFTKNKTYIELIKRDHTHQEIKDQITKFTDSSTTLQLKREAIIAEGQLLTKYVGKNGKKKLEEDLKLNEKTLTIISTQLQTIDSSLLTIQKNIEEEKQIASTNNHNDFINITNTLTHMKNEQQQLTTLQETCIKNKPLLTSFNIFTIKDIDTYVAIIEDLKNYYDKISSLINIDYLQTFDIFENHIKDMLKIEQKYKENLSKMDSEVLFLSNQIYGLENSTITKELLELRPKSCFADCGIVNEILRHINPDKEINTLKNSLGNKIAEKSDLQDKFDALLIELQNYQKALDLINEINNKLFNQKEFISLLPEFFTINIFYIKIFVSFIQRFQNYYCNIKNLKIMFIYLIK